MAHSDAAYDGQKTHRYCRGRSMIGCKGGKLGWQEARSPCHTIERSLWGSAASEYDTEPA